MTYQGERARPLPSEAGRCFEVSKIRLDADGRISDVLWSEVGETLDREVAAPVVVPTADVVDAIHDGAQVAAVFVTSAARLPERLFVVVGHGDGSEGIVLDEAPTPKRTLVDIARLDGSR